MWTLKFVFFPKLEIANSETESELTPNGITTRTISFQSTIKLGYNDHVISYNDHGYNDYGYDDHGYNDHGYDDHGYDDHGYNDHGYNDDIYNDHGYNELMAITNNIHWYFWSQMATLLH